MLTQSYTIVFKSQGAIVKLVYIENLGHDNYKEYVEEIRSSIKELIRFEELGLRQLSSLTGVSRQSLYRHFRENSGISFESLNKFNNFLRDYKLRLER